MDEDVSNETGGGMATAPEHADHAAPDAQIDIARLADKVYRLMREELRLERARGVSTGRR